MAKKKSKVAPQLSIRIDAKLREQLEKEAALFQPRISLSAYIIYLLETHPGRLKSSLASQ